MQVIKIIICIFFSDTKVTFSDKEEDILFNVLKKKTDDFENLKKFGTTEDKSTYTEAFKKAIEDPNDDVVGGLFIECYGRNGEFHYPEKMTSFVEMEHTVTNNGSIILFDSVANGGYTSYFYESKDLVSLYIYQMNRGIRYCPTIQDRQYDHLRFPNVYNLNEEQFIKKYNLTEPSIRIVF